MSEFLQGLFRADFLPHGWCYRWAPEVVWLHVTSDLLITLAYYFIPFALIHILRRRGDLVYPWMFWLFGLFILACGTTHLMNVVTVWKPWYRLDGIVKLITAMASVPTAILLLRIAPAVIALPSPAQLRAINDELAREINDRKAAEEEVRRLNADLERRVADRTRELEEANQLLRESEVRLRSILDSTPLLVYLKDADDRITFVNREYEKAFGVSRDQVVGKTGPEILPADAAAAYRAADLEVWGDGKPHEFEETAWQNGRQRTYVSAKFPLFDREGKPYALCGMSADITDRKEAEVALKSYAADLEQFAFVAAHDLQEPLRTVRTYTQLLFRKNEEHFNAESREFVDFIIGGVKRMYDLVADLQSYTELSRDSDRRADSCDAQEVLSDTLRSMDTTLREAGATVTYGPLPRLKISDRRLGQVFQNLISNAVKYRSPERPPEVHISSKCAERFCDVTVRDNGMGLKMQYAEQIFKVFKRLHGREIPGTGIGLAIVKRVVETSGGQAWVVSEPDKGAEFHVRLPLAP